MQMKGFMSASMHSHVVTCTNYTAINSDSEYNDDGRLIEPDFKQFVVRANVQPATDKEAEFLTGQGGSVVDQRIFKVIFNDRQQVYQEGIYQGVDVFCFGQEDGFFAEDHLFALSTEVDAKPVRLKASIIEAVINGYTLRMRVVYSDNRPHRNYCKAFAIAEDVDFG